MKGRTEILLVEDNQHDQELILQILGQENLADTTQAVENGSEALDFIFCRGAFSGRNCEPPRLVLLDLNLPRVSGLEVLQQIKSDACASTIPVAVLTSSWEGRDLAASYQLGANSYIQKPVELQQFREAVRRTALYWLVTNQRPVAQDTRATRQAAP